MSDIKTDPLPYFHATAILDQIQMGKNAYCYWVIRLMLSDSGLAIIHLLISKLAKMWQVAVGLRELGRSRNTHVDESHCPVVRGASRRLNYIGSGFSRRHGVIG
jgi:hypothetical protein